MVPGIFALTSRVQAWEGRGQTTLFAKLFNLRSESTENRALTPPKPPTKTHFGNKYYYARMRALFR